MIEILQNKLAIVAASLAVVLLGVGTVTVLWTQGYLPWAASEGDATPALMVNDNSVSHSEFDEAYKRQLQEYRTSLSQRNLAQFQEKLAGAPGAHYELQLKSNLADRLIRNMLRDQAAQEFNIEISESKVEQRLRDRIRAFLQENSVPEERIQKELEDPQTYESDFAQNLRERVRQQLLERRLRERVVGSIDPSESELRSYFEERKLRYYQPKLVHVRHILIEVPQNASAERVQSARQEIHAIRQQWEEGADFQSLARQRSEDERTADEGGDYGWIQEGSPAGESFVEAAFALEEPGQVSEPVRNDRGFHLIQLVERRAGEGQTYEDVADQVRRDYIEETTDSKYKDWFQSYRRQADIQINLPLLKAYRLEDTNPDEALAAYKEIRQANSVDDPYLSYYIGRLYRQKLQSVRQDLAQLEGSGDNADKAQELKQRVDQLRENVISNLRRVLDSGKREQDIYTAILDLAPDRVEVRYEFARLLMDQGRWERAKQELEKTLDDDPEHAAARASYGRLLLKMGQLDAATGEMERALEAATGSDDLAPVSASDLRLDLARAYRQLGQLDSARQHLETILGEMPNHAEASFQLGEILMQQDAPSDAVPYLETALENASSQEQRTQLRIQLGRAHTAAGNLDRGEELLKQATDTSSPPVESHLHLGDLHRQRGEDKAALEQYRRGLDVAVGWETKEQLAQRIVELDPNALDARRTLVDLYEKRGQYGRVIKQYRAILDAGPESPLDAWRGLGEAYLQTERHGQAIDAFQEGLNAEGASASERAGLWRRIFETDMARNGDSRQNVSETGLNALFRLAELSIDEGHFQKAADYVRQLVDADASFRSERVRSLIRQLQQQGVDVTLPSQDPDS